MPYRYGSAGHTRQEQIDAQLDGEGAFNPNYQLILACTSKGRAAFADAMVEDGCRIGRNPK